MSSQIEQSQGTSSKKVLVVDRNASTLKTISDVLHTQGYNVIEASNPQECINKALSVKPDMIIIDALFSQEADLVKTLRFEKELENVLFIMLSDNFPTGRGKGDKGDKGDKEDKGRRINKYSYHNAQCPLALSEVERMPNAHSP